MAVKEKKTSNAKSKTKTQGADKLMKSHLINKYRTVVASRYDYQTIKKNKKIPKGITPVMVDSLWDYFLNNLYPEAVQREKLDAAFSELENFMMHPSKVWDLLGNITSAVFRFGFQFPAAVKAGIVSMEAYTSAKHFENTLTHAATDKGFSVPVTDEQFYECLVAIPKEELEKFISELEHLFASFTNTDLLAKTISIMQDVVRKMEDKGSMYSANEVEAIQLGLDIMQKGYDLFIDYDDEMKEALLLFVTNNEKAFLNSLYK